MNNEIKSRENWDLKVEIDGITEIVKTIKFEDNGSVTLNGGEKMIPPEKSRLVIINGNCGDIHVDGNVLVTGRVYGPIITYGDVHVNGPDAFLKGSVTTVYGDVYSGEIIGDVEATNGWVSAYVVEGDVQAVRFHQEDNVDDGEEHICDDCRAEIEAQADAVLKKAAE